MIARQFVLSSSSFFSDTLPSQHSSSSMVCTIELIILNTHLFQHSSFSTLIVLNTHRFQHSSLPTLIELYGLYHRAHCSQHSSLPTLFSTLFVINTLCYQHSSSSMVCTIELITPILSFWHHGLTFDSATRPALDKLRTSTLFEFDGLYHRAHPSQYSASGTSA
ncbi:hypothetical protein P692DRAFT_20883476 [Suillus brevipes Sb2]|nr:hypothetical protein P692DRAFT_20883476 [Suillus brevipes Sb2]